MSTLRNNALVPLTLMQQEQAQPQQGQAPQQAQQQPAQPSQAQPQQGQAPQQAQTQAQTQRSQQQQRTQRLPSKQNSKVNMQSTRKLKFKNNVSISPDTNDIIDNFARITGNKIDASNRSKLLEFMNKVLPDQEIRKRYDSKQSRLETQKDITEHFGFNMLDQKEFNEYIENTPGIDELELESPSNLIKKSKAIAKNITMQKDILREYEQIKKDMQISDIYDFGD